MFSWVLWVLLANNEPERAGGCGDPESVAKSDTSAGSLGPQDLRLASEARTVL